MAASANSLQNRNRLVALVATGVVVAMVGAAYASVPLYRLFCQVTGYGGATNVAAAAPGVTGERIITVEFDANVSGALPWDFRPAQRRVDVRVGEEGLAFYTAANPTARAITGTATFNVSPAKAGKYFSKVACFCFTEQTLQPGQSVDMGVAFFVDPAILDDRDLAEVNRITLSYTFFETGGAEAAVDPAVVRPATPARAGGAH
ncbi:MAG: cytochrome c oxidase assembly protein [Proteobacteria bacterium]|nr:cytochrome c oxidase assembly protein [Pseudomonadota bacterium]